MFKESIMKAPVLGTSAEKPNKKLEVITGVDFGLLFKQRENLFTNIENNQKELDRDELLDLSAKLLEFSAKDGLAIIEKLRLTPSEIADLIARPAFVIKHIELVKRIKEAAKSSSSKIKNKDLFARLIDGLDNLIVELETEPTTLAEAQKQQRLFTISKPTKDNSSEFKRIYQQMSDYYQQFVVSKKFENIDGINDQRTKGEKTGEDSLDSILPSLEGKYLTGDLLNAIYQYLKSNDFETINNLNKTESSNNEIVLDYLEQAGWHLEDIEQLRFNQLTSKELADNLKTFLKFDDFTNRKLDKCRYKPLDLVYNVKKKMAEEQLIKEIEISLKSRYPDELKVIFDEQTKSYKVNDAERENDLISDNSKLAFESEIKNIESSKYDKIKDVVNINNQIFFHVKKDDHFFIINEDGLEIGREYDEVTNIYKINNKLFYKAKKDEYYFFVTEAGVEIGRDKEYDKVDNIKCFNNQIVYTATKDGHSFIATEDGREIGKDKEYDEAYNTNFLNNQIVYAAIKDKHSFIATEDGREIGRNYERVEDVCNFNNQLIYLAAKPTKKPGTNVLVTEDGREISKDYDCIKEINLINDQMFYVASIGHGNNFVVTSDSREIGREKMYDNVREVKYINNQLTFIASKDRNFDEIKDNYKLGRPGFEWLDRMFTGHKRTDQVVAIEDGREIGKGKYYSEISKVKYINNKIVYLAKKGVNLFIATEDGREIGKEYDGVEEIYNINEHIVYLAKRKDYKTIDYSVIVTEDGREVSPHFKEIYSLSVDGNKMYVVGQIDNNKEKKEVIKETIIFEKIDQHELTEDEERKLELLNLVNNPKEDKINDYFKNKSKQKEQNNKTLWQNLKSGYENSKTLVKGLNKMVSEIPEVFLNTMSAQSDKNKTILRDQFLMKIFPEIFSDEPSDWLGYFRNQSGSNQEKTIPSRLNKGQAEDPSGYLNPEVTSFASGDPSGEQGAEKSVMEFRGAINDFIATNILGAGLSNPETYAKSYFSLNHKSEGPFTEKTITLPNIGNMNRIRLPKPISATIIKERVKGVTKDNQEILLETEINSLGEATALIGKNKVDKIIYSIQISQDPLEKIIPEKNISDYEKYKSIFTKENGFDLSENIADLPAEIELFADSLKIVPPKERIVAIERFVKQYGYYDFNNKEVNDLKNNKSVSEQVLIMEARMEQLKITRPDLKDRKYAGVCADFAILNTAILRRAGILSGLVAGFSSSEKIVTPSMAHGVSFVVMPDKNNQNQVFTVDATPDGTNQEEREKLAEIVEPSIEDIEKNAQELISKEKIEAEKILMKIEDIISDKDLESIRQLNNGQLENALNTILRYEVKTNHLVTINRILSAYWYSPLNNIDFTNNNDRLYFQEALKDEINRVRQEIGVNPDIRTKPAGSELFNSIQDFIHKFNKEKNQNGLDLIDEIIDINKNELTLTEEKVLTVISNYLKAKKMVGEKSN